MKKLGIEAVNPSCLLRGSIDRNGEVTGVFVDHESC